MEKGKWLMLPLLQGLELCIKWRFGITDLIDSKKNLDYVKACGYCIIFLNQDTNKLDTLDR